MPKRPTVNDLTTRLLAAIEATEFTAKAASPGTWDFDGDEEVSEDVGDWPVAYVRGAMQAPGTQAANGGHIAANDPDTVLRRCAADRKMVNLHATTVFETIRGNPKYGRDYWCETCHVPGDQGGRNWCETLRLLAEGYGITEEAA